MKIKSSRKYTVTALAACRFHSMQAGIARRYTKKVIDMRKRPKKNDELAERFLRAMLSIGCTPKGGAKAFLRRLKEVK